MCCGNAIQKPWIVTLGWSPSNSEREPPAERAVRGCMRRLIWNSMELLGVGHPSGRPLFPDLAPVLTARLPDDLVLDGEVIAWDPAAGRLHFEGCGPA